MKHMTKNCRMFCFCEWKFQ